MLTGWHGLIFELFKLFFLLIRTSTSSSYLLLSYQIGISIKFSPIQYSLPTVKCSVKLIYFLFHTSACSLRVIVSSLLPNMKHSNVRCNLS
jgi:hypothetical protein